MLYGSSFEPRFVSFPNGSAMESRLAGRRQSFETDYFDRSRRVSSTRGRDDEISYHSPRRDDF